MINVLLFSTSFSNYGDFTTTVTPHALLSIKASDTFHTMCKYLSTCINLFPFHKKNKKKQLTKDTRKLTLTVRWKMLGGWRCFCSDCIIPSLIFRLMTTKILTLQWFRHFRGFSNPAVSIGSQWINTTLWGPLLFIEKSTNSFSLCHTVYKFSTSVSYWVCQWIATILLIEHVHNL